MKVQHMQIGKAAARAGVNIQTLRYYERRGLLPKPVRSGASNYRLYTDETVRQVRFVKDAQSIGFALREIRELIALRTGSSDVCTDLRERAMVKIAEIDDKIRNLNAMREVLAKLVETCPGSGSDDSCPTLGKLEQQEDEE
jgi:MerR family mercuric resistance operon transcriptional regulator